QIPIFLHIRRWRFPKTTIPLRGGGAGAEQGTEGRFSSEKQKNEDRNVLIIAEKAIDKNAFII
ncbi:MAG: hypothetical protein MR828_08065, partial [Clostridiales bacterium]|nr:hypothetical protein [Clostridiales bacterium]